MEVDVATGLPELPEGQCWQVDYASRELLGVLWGNSFPDKTRLQVRLIEETTEVRRTTSGRLWWKQTTEKTVQIGRTISQRDCQGTAPIAVLNAARWIMKEQARLAQTAALVGKYPPRSLVAVVPSE